MLAICLQDLDSGVVTPEDLPEATVSQENDKEEEATPSTESAPEPTEAAPEPTETAPEPMQAAAIEETPQPGSPVEAQQDGPSNVIALIACR